MNCRFLNKKLGFYFILFLLATAGLIALIVHPFWISTDLRSNLWAPTYLLVRGQNPYNTTVLMTQQRWLNPVWFPMIIGLLFPLGWLTVYQATNLWLLLNLAILVTMLWWAAYPSRPPLFWFALLMLSILLFPPTVGHLRLGQLSLPITWLWWMAALELDHSLLAAGAIAVALSKPQLGILVLPGMLWASYRRQGFKRLAYLTVFTIVIVLTLTIPLFLADSNWPAFFLRGLCQNPSWQHPSLLYVLRQTWGGWGTAAWIGVTLIGLMVNFWLWTKRPPEQAVLWSLALTPLISPYIWSWDFVLLIPLAAHLIFHSPPARWGIGAGYVLCWALMLYMDVNMGSHKTWWIPWILFAFFCMSYVVGKNKWTNPTV